MTSPLGRVRSSDRRSRWAAATGSNLVVAVEVTQAPNDKQQVEPMLAELEAVREHVGACGTLLADTGYYSAGN